MEESIECDNLEGAIRQSNLTNSVFKIVRKDSSVNVIVWCSHSSEWNKPADLALKLADLICALEPIIENVITVLQSGSRRKCVQVSRLYLNTQNEAATAQPPLAVEEFRFFSRRPPQAETWREG